MITTSRIGIKVATKAVTTMRESRTMATGDDASSSAHPSPPLSPSLTCAHPFPKSLAYASLSTGSRWRSTYTPTRSCMFDCAAMCTSRGGVSSTHRLDCTVLIFPEGVSHPHTTSLSTSFMFPYLCS
ncbi:hypothetical protein M413DRAFT_191316 [Hebeloma cylindrosporum]|uniref:Uncharacterized protein n=1 Tax=Hebeloma cylindrosporum TaxID=76867 RepID=A0A0C3C5B8_HEBCY|nr:hypothetical protein M413DRAFT_191316 [Hebeloma cylindrosporum h7]